MRNKGVPQAAFEKGVQDAKDGKDEPDSQTIEKRVYYLMGRHIGRKLPLNGELMAQIEQTRRRNAERFDADLFRHLVSVYEFWPQVKRGVGKPDRKNMGTAAGEDALHEMEEAKHLSCCHRPECMRELASEMASQAAFSAPGSPVAGPSALSPSPRSGSPRPAMRGRTLR